jgi:protease-4
MAKKQASPRPGHRAPPTSPDLLERLVQSLLDERRRARRWGNLFKSLLAALLVLLLLVQLHNLGERAPLAGRYSALVELDGVIETDGNASADNVIAGLRAAFASHGTAGVILRANSPGGSAVEAGYIYDEIRRLREKYPHTPLYGVIGDLCASGCYYALAAADRIYASPASVVGSIGVLIDAFGFPEALKKLGIERRLLTAGEHKGMLDPFLPLDAPARRHTQVMLDEVHRQFIQAVKQGRGAALKDDPKIFSGLIWTGERARALGLVDDFASAGQVAREVIGAEEIADFTVQESVFDRFARRFGAAMARTLATEGLGRGAFGLR